MEQNQNSVGRYGRLTLKYLRSECSWISEQICEFMWKKCCGCSQSLLQTDFNVSVLHHPVLSNRSSAVP
ncbi:hypothetical protein AV530_012535 [Patagioenas fasciata monilis]|uniref:Uncharacterized protein n=1 Tax=Patagioenas fasciata monilis TaxID=372326 RepID=A0A1V4JBM3_PATFA|nr:hypothetical protein AV530_012535 [Patagioenas fasciata monilis]